MTEAVYHTEFGLPRLGYGTQGLADATSHLASQMYTDAVFNSDIRVIQLIINRIDGGLPKDSELNEYQTLFGDCLNQVLGMESHIQLKVLPEDSVMMALCKALYEIASRDIYHEYKEGPDGKLHPKKVNPSTEKKQARDSAMRLVLERAGGRKSALPANQKTFGTVKVARWIREVLPLEGEASEPAAQESDSGGVGVAH